jgi:hypothetical protein
MAAKIRESKVEKAFLHRNPKKMADQQVTAPFAIWTDDEGNNPSVSFSCSRVQHVLQCSNLSIEGNEMVEIL